MKTELISARLPREDALVLEEIAKEQKTDKTTALRTIFGLGTKQYRIEKAVKQYQAGRISIGRAAEIANLSLWEIMDELNKRNLVNPLTAEDYQQGLQNLKKAWK